MKDSRRPSRQARAHGSMCNLRWSAGTAIGRSRGSSGISCGVVVVVRKAQQNCENQSPSEPGRVLCTVGWAASWCRLVVDDPAPSFAGLPRVIWKSAIWWYRFRTERCLLRIASWRDVWRAPGFPYFLAETGSSERCLPWVTWPFWCRLA